MVVRCQEQREARTPAIGLGQFVVVAQHFGAPDAAVSIDDAMQAGRTHHLQGIDDHASMTAAADDDA